MKSMSDLVKKEIPLQSDNKLVHFYASSEGYKPIDPPRYSQEMSCPFCGSEDFFMAMIDKDRRVWMCGSVCKASRLPKNSSNTDIAPPSIRELEWALFCEISGIGDMHHDVKFEKIQQSNSKLAYLLKFALKPYGIIFMKGAPGTGKTYACLGVCEFFTRKDSSCIFCTQTQLHERWLHTFKSDDYFNFIHRVKTCCLLVIDDFATGEISPSFMKFLMDLINSRMQWSDKGTIINTNLNNKDFSIVCGEALSSRINTGVLFEYEGKDRRKPIKI